MFKYQIIIETSNNSSCKTSLIFKNKIRFSLSDKNKLLNFMKDKKPGEELVVVYRPSIDLFREFELKHCSLKICTCYRGKITTALLLRSDGMEG